MANLPCFSGRFYSKIDRQRLPVFNFIDLYNVTGGTTTDLLCGGKQAGEENT